MLCKDCRFVEVDSEESNHGHCNIKLPGWLQQRENGNGRIVWISEHVDDGCDLGQPKDQNAHA